MKDIKIVILLKDPLICTVGSTFKSEFFKGFREKRKIYYYKNNYDSTIYTINEDAINFNNLVDTASVLEGNTQITTSVMPLLLHSAIEETDYKLVTLADLTREQLDSSFEIASSINNPPVISQPSVDSLTFLSVYCITDPSRVYTTEFRVTSNLRNYLEPLTRMKRVYEEAQVRFSYVCEESGYRYITNEMLIVNNTNISCGVSQLSNMNHTLDYLRRMFKEDGPTVLTKLFKYLEDNSPSSMVIYSTTKNKRNDYRDYYRAIENTYSSVTRYSFNDNSKNKIGTTMLILRTR